MQEELEWTKDDLAVFKIFDTTDENDLEVLRKGTHFDKDEEDRVIAQVHTVEWLQLGRRAVETVTACEWW